MHELAVTQSILEISLRYAQNAEAKQVTDIHLVIGQLSYVVDDSVQFYWDEIAKGTPAENARLHFKRVPAELLCLDCGHRYALDGEVLMCPSCMSIRVKIITGDEFHVESIDVDTSQTQTVMEK